VTAAKAFALVVNEPRVPSVFTCADTPIDPKCSTPPPGYTAPPPSRYPVRTSAEVLAGPATDPFVGPVASDVAFGHAAERPR
jgi:hypothetical protein